MIADFSLENRVELVIGRTPANWQQILAQAEIAIHLMFSVFEQPCPYLPLSMAAGKIVIVSDYAYSEVLPDGAVFKIPLVNLKRIILRN